MYRPISMYWRIIVDSVSDTKYFLLMVLVVILSFASGLYVLDVMQASIYQEGMDGSFKSRTINGQEVTDYFSLTSKRTEWGPYDQLLSVYVVMLGAYDILDNNSTPTYPTLSKNLVYFYFIGTTFFTQVVFFNTLVAVIGESYSERWQKRDSYALMQRTAIYSDYIKRLDT